MLSNVSNWRHETRHRKKKIIKVLIQKRCCGAYKIKPFLLKTYFFLLAALKQYSIEMRGIHTFIRTYPNTKTF